MNSDVALSFEWEEVGRGASAPITVVEGSVSAEQCNIRRLKAALMQALQLGGIQLASTPGYVFAGGLDQYVEGAVECPDLLAVLTELSQD